MDFKFHICSVIVRVLAFSVIDREFEPGLVKPKTIKLVLLVSPRRT